MGTLTYSPLSRGWLSGRISPEGACAQREGFPAAFTARRHLRRLDAVRYGA